MFFARFSRTDHAWHIVAATTVVSLLTVGLRFSTGPFVASIMDSLHLTHTQFSAIVAAALLVFGIGMPFAGWLTDRFGGRVVLTVGGVLLTGSLVTAASTSSPLVFALAWAGVGSVGFSATSHVTLSAVIGRWFVKHRGLAMTTLSSGGMGGVAILTPLSSALIARFGWRETLEIYAGIILVLVLICAAILGDRGPADGQAESLPAGARGSWVAALSTKPFWLLAVGFFTCGFSMNLLSTHGVPMLENHGFPTMTASFGIGLIGLVSVFGSLGLGIASDRMGRPLFLALIYAVRGLGFLGLIFAGRAWELYAVTALGGLVWAGSSALTSAVIVDTYGPKNVGILFGLIFLIHQIGGSTASFLGGWSFDQFGTFNYAFVLTAVVLFAGSYVSLRIPSARRLPLQAGFVAGD